jgi:PAS domain S-box-containing protein
MNKRTFLVVATLGAGGVWGGALAQPERLRYGGDAAFPPFEFIGADGRPQGFLVDVLHELERVNGRGIDITLAPWAQTDAGFRAGAIDMIAMIDSESRKAFVQFTRGVAALPFGVYRRAALPEPQGLRGLDGLRVAVLDSDLLRDPMTTGLLGRTGGVRGLPDAGSALEALIRNEADVAVLPRAYGDPALAARPRSGIVLSGVAPEIHSYAFALALGRDDLRAEVQRGLDVLEHDGRLEALRAKWLHGHRDSPERQRLEQALSRERQWNWQLVAGGAALAVLLGAMVVQRTRKVAREKRRRQRAEGALAKAHRLLEQTFANSADAMLIVEARTRIVRDANAAARALVGVPAEALLGRTLDALNDHVDADALAMLVHALVATDTLEAAPLRIRRADGAVRDCLVSADRFVLDGVAHVFCLMHDITDQIAADAALRLGYESMAADGAALRKALDEARQAQGHAVQAMQEYTRSLAHDLRTPLNAVHGFAGLLRMRLQAGRVEEALGFTDLIESAARRMNTMIGALARLCRIERQTLRLQGLDMRQMAQDTWTFIAATHPERQADFRLEGLPAAQGDVDLVVQVWQNLFDNASKYSSKVATPIVKVDSHRDARGLWFRITDNGVGFDMAASAKLFQPFQRLHTTAQFEGMGVGLTVVRRIVDAHGGEVRLRSAPAVGTVVEFTLDPAPTAG